MKKRNPMQKILAWLMLISLVMSTGISAWAGEPATEIAATQATEQTETEVQTEIETQTETGVQTEIEMQTETETMSETEMMSESETQEEQKKKETQKQKQPRAVVDSHFKVDNVSIKVGGQTIVPVQSPIPEFDITYGGVRLNIAVNFSQVVPESIVVNPNDTLEIKLCDVTADSAWQVLLNEFTENLEVWSSDNTIHYANAVLMTKTSGSTVSLVLKLTFTNQISGKKNITGMVSCGASLDLRDQNKNGTIKYEGEEAAKVIKGSKGGYDPMLAYKEYPGIYKESLGEISGSAGNFYNKWRIEINDYVEDQFTNTTSLDYLIVEDMLDHHQSFFTNQYNQAGLVCKVYAPIYFKQGENDENKTVGESNDGKQYVYDRGISGMRELGKPGSAQGFPVSTYVEANPYTGGFTDAESEVRATPKAWTIIKETDAGGKPVERLVINMGSPTDGSGYRFSEFFQNASDWQAVLDEIKDLRDTCKAIVDNNDSAPGATMVNGHSMYQWRASYEAYKASYDWYLTDPYVYNYKFEIETKILKDQADTNVVPKIKNTFAFTRGGSETELSAEQDNFWSTVIDAEASKGDVQIFKADTLYGNTDTPGKDDEKGDGKDPVEGSIHTVRFEVYKADGTGPLTFDYQLGKYIYNEAGTGQYAYVETSNSTGSAIIAGLHRNSNDKTYYYLKEIVSPDGYYSGQNQMFEFWVKADEISYQLANNVPRGVEFVKIDDAKKDSNNDPVTLPGAKFKLYKYTTKDGNGEPTDAAEVTGFTLTTINGVDYYVYDGSGTDELVTLADGSMKIVQLYAGKYYLEESVAPAGYELSDEKHYFELSDTLATGAEPIVDLGTIGNKALTEIEVEKVWKDAQGNILMPDSSFIESVEVQLMIGTTEVTGKTLTLSANTDPNKNWKGKFSELPAYDASGQKIMYTVVEKAVTYASGVSLDQQLSYTSEVGAMIGSVGQEKITVTNTVKGKLIINKSGDGNALDGVKFRLQEATVDAGGNWDVKPGGYDGYHVTANGGVIEVDGLEAIYYLLTEVETVDGYQLLKEPVKITIPYQEISGVTGPTDTDAIGITGADGNTYHYHLTYHIENLKTYEIPETGASGIALYYLLGIILITVGLGHLILSRKKTMR